ncbi:MAG TPA: M15 family metallopeptidase [Tenuifilaceae bacterium]|nr:M15 family metallopeptidase [Tenuifilaceae bacterium]
MNADVLISLVVILLPLSFISERIANLIKLFLPTGFLGVGNLRYKENDPVQEKRRERRIFGVSLFSGLVVAFALRADLFTILNNGSFGWTNYPEGYSWIVGCLFSGFFLSWGSRFWHDLLGILLEMKNIKRANVEEKSVDLKKKNLDVKLLEDKCEEETEVTNILHQADRPKPEMDGVTIKRIAKLHPKLRLEAEQIYNEILEKGIAVRFTDTLRTFAEQDALYAQGRTKPGKIVTNAKAGQSFHNYGLALDFCLLINNGKQVSWDRNTDINANEKFDWDEVVAVFKHYGWEWGGDWTRFKDYPHFQRTFGKSTAELLTLHNSSKVDEEGYVLIS